MMSGTMEYRLWLFLLKIWLLTDICNGFCKEMKLQEPNTPSGVYKMETTTGKTIEVYCEMGLNGGGYTFLHPTTLTRVNNEDIAPMFTDTSTFLLRVLKNDVSQPFAVLSQLQHYSTIPLNIGINSHGDYTSAPANAQYLGIPYIYFGFLPRRISSAATTQGLRVNGITVSYTPCGTVAASHIVLFPDFGELPPSNSFIPNGGGPVYSGIFGNTSQNPSRRLMPVDFFMFGEIHFSACGCYVQTDQMSAYGVVNIAIGFR